MNLAFGCSHTAGVEGNESWTVLCERMHGIAFENLGRLGGGLFHILGIARSFAASHDVHTVRHVVLQKPEFVRFPWFCTEAEFFRQGGVLRARSDFRALPSLAQRSLAREIYDHECTLLDEFVELFPAAKFAFWQQWSEHLIATHWEHPFVLWLDRFEEYAKAKGFESFGTIIDWKPIHAEAVAHGKLLSEGWMASLIRQGWIISDTNGHTTTKHNALVATRVAEWVRER